MAKLYGTADSTLVAAAFKESMSKVPLDLSGVYKQRALNIKNFSTGISGIFDSIYAENNALKEEITTKSQLVAEIMQTEGGLNNEYATREHIKRVNGFKSRAKKINPLKAGDIDRQNLKIEMDKYNRSMQASTAMLQGMVSNAGNERMLYDLDSDEAKLYNLILDDAINGTYENKPTYDKGEMVYSLPGKPDVKMTMADINKGLSAHDPAFLTDFHANLNKLATTAKTLGGAMTAKDVVRWKNNTNGKLINWNQIRNVAQEKFGGATHSFEEVLHGQAKDPVSGAVDTAALRILFEQLDDIGGIDMDGDGNSATMKDGVNIDRGMYTNFSSPENGAKLIEALKKDKTKYKELMVGYLGETVIKDYWQQGADQYKGKQVITPEIGKEGYAPFSTATAGEGVLGKNHPIKKSTLTSYWNQLNSGTIGNYKMQTDGSWTDGDQTVTGDKMMEGVATKLAEMVPEGQYYTRDAQFWLDQLKNNASFKSFFGGTTSYKMPKSQEKQVAKLWNNAKEGLTGSTEKYAVSTLNTTFGGGFTQEDALNKWTIGYNGKMFNLKNESDKDKLLEEIKIQQLIDSK